MSDSPDAPLPIDPVLQFDAWLEKATPEEIEAAEPKYEADLIAYQKDTLKTSSRSRTRTTCNSLC